MPRSTGGALAHARAALVDDEEREHVVARQYLRDALDMLGERRRDVRLPLTRQLPSGADEGPTPLADTNAGAPRLTAPRLSGAGTAVAKAAASGKRAGLVPER